MTKPFYYKQAADLKMNVLNFLPAHLHHNIEFSFQIFDKEQTNKLPGWRWGFSTFRIDAANHLCPVPESKAHPEKGKKNITSHTHLTRNQAVTTKGWLQQGYVYTHWKLLLPGDTPNHQWDVEKMKSAKGQPVMQPVYVGESGVATSPGFFGRSTQPRRTSNHCPDKLNWSDEVVGGYAIWIVNGLPPYWRLRLETHCIETYGRHDLGKGPLVNRTNGGERNDGRLQGRPQSQETRQKLSDAAFMREQTISDATKAARSAKLSDAAFMREQTISDATKAGRSAKISAAKTGVLLSDEHKAAISAGSNEREKSREIVLKWVTEQCADKTPEEKYNALPFCKLRFRTRSVWKVVSKQPRRTSRWYTVAFERAGQWYSIDETIPP